VIEEIVDRYSAPTDFIGHIGSGGFVVIVPLGKAEAIVEHLQAHFANGIRQCYPNTVTSAASPSCVANALHKWLHQSDKTPNMPAAPVLSLVIDVLRSTDGPFADVNDIVDKAAASLRR
jgi:hypothetical protein